MPKTFLIVVTDFALTGFNGTDQLNCWGASALGVFGSKGKLIIPFETTFNSVLEQETESEGFAYPAPAPTDFDKFGNAAVGHALAFAVTISAWLWLLNITKKTTRDENTANSRYFFTI